MSQTLRRARRSTWLQRAAVFGIVASSIGVLCLPQPYRVSASCTLEPVLRRIVCAPYDGLLEESLVEPGMLVERDATLARMDAREIRWELASVIAERHQARKDYERNLSGGEITKAQLAQLDDQRLGKKLELLEAREVNHELRSPVEGIVLKGSVERSSSVPVKLGQPLFEVAQLHPLRLEIDIPADDYAHVKPGQSVEVTLDGIADRAVSGTVEKIRPRSEIRDGRNVFVAEVVVANEDQLLRPGMRGRANIATASHPLVWNLFHKAWDAMWRSDPTTLFAQSNATTSQHGATQIANRPMRLRRDAVNDEEQPQLANRPTERGDDVLPPPRTVLIPDGIIRR